jgi:tRNA A-37 threonylcarbamoyl transferase component Bud32
MADSVDPHAAASPSAPRTEPKTVTLTLDGGHDGTVREPDAPPPAGDSATRPFGDYELLGEIERGGQGIVYRARERHSGRLVALKMMLGERSSGPADLQRFILEAKATSEIDHPGVVAIHAWGEHESHPFYTMDFVPGQPLHRLLEKGPLPCDRAVRYLVGIARAVAAAHALGIVHRDLKPGNVIIDPGDQPRILDFGLAKRQRSAPPPERGAAEIVDVLPADAPVPPPAASPSPGRLTALGAIVGTPAYMAPEQVRAQHDRIGPHSDVYALGAIFYEMLTGKPPFQGETTLNTLRQVVQQPARPVRQLNPRVPAALEALCARCLEKEPQHRYPEAGALADDLERRWAQITQTRRFARLTAAAALTIVALQLLQILLLHGLRVDAGTLAARVGDLAGGNLFRLAAEGLVRLGWSIAFGLAPCLAELGLGVWLGLWVWHSSQPRLLGLLWLLTALAVLAGWIAAGAPFLTEVLLFFPLLLPVNALVALAVALARWRPGQEFRTADGPPESEPFLQKLFAIRGARRARPAAPAERQTAPWLGDFELGKALHRGGACTVRRARQVSLDRPVLMWVDRSPAADAARPGVVVRHPDVLALHAIGRTEEGWCLVTAPAAAVPLAELIERRGLQPGEAVTLAARLGRILQAFHEQGVCHGRLGAEWVLVHGDLEPLLCPCGVPSQSAADHARDLVALGRLLHGWLPPPPRAWQRRWLAPVYRVCDAAERGEYRRAADLAADLERAARFARIRWRQGYVTALVVFLVLLPLLCLAASRGAHGSIYLLLATAPAALVLGYGHGRALVYRRRLLVGDPARDRVLKSSWFRVLLPVGVVLVPAALLGWVARPDSGGVGSAVHAALTAGGMAAAFWLLGMAGAGLVAFGEFLLASVKRQ